MTIYLHQNDLPDDLALGPVVAVDTEAMGLRNRRDRLCLAQLSDGNGDVHLVQFADRTYQAPNLVRVLADPDRLKLFHYARFDVAILKAYLGVDVAPLYCTKIASRLVRTYTDRHGLKVLCQELIGVDISKQQQSSDWGAAELSEAQQAYAASDVLYLHRIKAVLDAMLEREGRSQLAQSCFDFLPTRVALDLLDWDDTDIFAHA